MDKGTRLREKLQGPFSELQQAARSVAKVVPFPAYRQSSNPVADEAIIV